jgi:phosphatidylglycerol:prolipoprotein diacylglycerol transferase
MNIFENTPDRVAFSIGGIDIMWYGILIACGFALCIYIVCRRAPRHGLTGDKALNYAIFISVAGIIGARLYYIIFKLPYYLEDPARMLQVREGGLAIHGGLIAGCVMAIVLCKLWKDNPLNIMDLFFVAVPLGQAIGRWGNYFNAEAHGGPTGLPWGILVDGQKVHPSFLYESLWCLFLFLLLWQIDNRRKFTGQTFTLYCILYSAERFLVEGMRTDSLMLGPLKQAQVLSMIVIVGAAVAYYFGWQKKARLPDAAISEPDIEQASQGEEAPPPDETNPSGTTPPADETKPDGEAPTPDAEKPDEEAPPADESKPDDEDAEAPK